ncbi:MAG: glycosyltransferase family 2 protein [Acidocella sp.]|nr:glycosyltransferase family 2 protein [Acidocella sp.]
MDTPESARPRASVIISTYNAPEALEISLESFRHQREKNFEIIVADDGSTPATAELIKRIAANFPVPIKHVWHPDEGFRLSAIRNLAAAQASSDYIIFIDGDCLVLKNFVSQHLRLREPGMFLSGRRTWLGRVITRRILARRKPGSGYWPYWFMWALAGQVTGPFELLTAPAKLSFRYRLRGRYERAQTCNLAVWKADFMAIGGFDERYQAHGFEDSDFVVRLIRSGVPRKEGVFGSIVLHLNHPRPSRKPSPNAGMFAELQASERVMAGHIYFAGDQSGA